MAFTDEDKRWLAAQLGRLDPKIEKLDAKIEQVERRLDARIEQVESRLDAKIEKVETALLTEFHKWESPHDARLRTHTSALRTFDLDLEALTERVKRVADQRPH